MIVFRNVSKKYRNGMVALKNLSLYIPEGSITFITGHSGAGKTTLLKLIALNETATNGQVFVDNQDLAKLRGRGVSRYRRNVGFVFQEHRLLADRTVERNVSLPLVVAGLPEHKCRSRVRAALELVSLTHLAESYPDMLSVGEQQRVGIARAMIARPDLILADEPTGNLDPGLADEVMRVFFRLQEHETTVVIATHDYRHLNNPAAGCLMLDHGQLVVDESL
ncbi:MAG: ATP-binding cassette domain-containing protein [Gammaproteobacteria bacterium]|nr:ATP-binding cassette domain-containing protein [Gammaproteobacteria bacterium]MCY4227305.1 ATP-binding cassette domain-containing protein [Gammaproteobacteria bacterium]MCY4313328.1 ATP-binding cassette domain-containing protein [Gammaproteobacteria bacterium]